MSVTVMLGGDEASVDAAVQTAINLTKQLKTTLTGLCAFPEPANSVVYITGAETVNLGAAAIQSLQEAQDKLVNEIRAAFESKTAAAGAWLRADFKREIGSVASHAAAAAVLSDAFIVPKEATNSSHPLNPAFEHVLMEANLPLVLAPTKVASSDTCVIGWDGGPLAARAVRMHMPLIRTFKKAVIAQNPSKIRHQWAHVSKDSIDRLKLLLQEERLEVSTMETDGPISTGLMQTAKSTGASLIVMGAYGHSRIGQLLFGGTTAKIIHDDDAPALALCR